MRQAGFIIALLLVVVLILGWDLFVVLQDGNYQRTTAYLIGKALKSIEGTK